MKQYLNTIRSVGVFLLVIGFAIATLWGSPHAFFPLLFAVILIGIVMAYKALHWHEYEKDNKRNAWIMLAIVVLLFMNTFFPL